MTAGLTKELRKQIYKRDGYRCALCDSTDGLQIHHYIPRGKGGCNHPMNLITLCWRCHAAAHGSICHDFYLMDITAENIQAAHNECILQMEYECARYLGDYYAEEKGEVWYPWEG